MWKILLWKVLENPMFLTQYQADSFLVLIIGAINLVLIAII